jgi:dipeptidyl aminopeptidase/acylaminoacyl peptidase
MPNHRFDMREARLLFTALLLINIAPCGAKERRFTVTDDIAFVHFGHPYEEGKADAVTFSPDRRYFVVYTERGLIEKDRCESTLRVFRAEDVRHFISRPTNSSGRLEPIWTFSESTYKDAPVISEVRWLADSSNFAFLLRSESGNNRLFLTNLKTRKLRPLTAEGEDVTTFRIRDRKDYVYGVQTSTLLQNVVRRSNLPAIVGTGRSFFDLMFPPDKYPSFASALHDVSELWAVVAGKRSRVIEKESGQPLRLFGAGLAAMALSPNGDAIVTVLPVPTVPPAWELLYPPPSPLSSTRIRAHHRDPEDPDVNEFVRVDLTDGRVRVLTNAPSGDSAGWWNGLHADWSADGRLVVLSNTFLPETEHGSRDELARPCIAVVDLAANSTKCLDRLKGQTLQGYEPGWEYMESVGFLPGSPARVMVGYQQPGGKRGTKSYIHSTDGLWEQDSSLSDGSQIQENELNVSVQQSFRDPPLLVATDTATGSSRIILDPNPDLRNIDLGQAYVLKWKDKTGHEWSGGLYMPPDYIQGQRYPLVLQTHGFFEGDFDPSGIWPTGAAARELAAVGIMVLQVDICPVIGTPQEGLCNVELYESAVDKLVGDGLADPTRIGIIGFSRTCYHVLELLTSSKMHFTAASITDGVNEGYLQYIMNVDYGSNGLAHEYDAMIGTSPFGEGLQKWVARSPDFNMDKVTTPLLVVANGPEQLPEMWEPYAVLRYCQKPVDLIVLRGGTHILTNPAERMISQGGSVDWFRFWLQGYEDPNPGKTDEYNRWRKMRHRLQ